MDGELVAGLVSGVTVVFVVLIAAIVTLCLRDRLVQGQIDNR